MTWLAESAPGPTPLDRTFGLRPEAYARFRELYGGLWDPAVIDEVVAVRTEDAKEMARRIAREEALFAGTSSGANVLAAIQVGLKLGPEATVVTLMADSGLKYLSTDVYRRR